MSELAALDAVLPLLRCPVCAAELGRTGQRLACAAGHSFDVARQGYVNLAVGRHAGTADSAAMVAARHQFLERGHYRPVADAVAHAVADSPTVVDLAGGTGYYLARVLDRTGGRGLCLDLSVPALRRAARVDPRAAAVGADAWRPLPLVDGECDAVLSIFGPRDPDEVERVLAPGGLFVVVSPGPDHLAELIEPLSMLTVHPDKSDRAATAFARFEPRGREALHYRVQLTADEAYAVAAMGPAARHATHQDLRARAAALPDPVDVTVDVTVTTYRRRPDPPGS